MSTDRIQQLREEIFALNAELCRLQGQEAGKEIPDYSFVTLDGEVSLRELFGGKDKLLAIHNMGQGCRYCTLWADGLNGFLPHLESVVSVVLLSRDPPELQRRFANSRGWRFRMASHGGGDYIREQTAEPGYDNMPGVVAYELRDGVILRKNSAAFGPGDQYCSAWNFLGLLGIEEGPFTPQFDYWLRPATLDDGGENVLGE